MVFEGLGKRVASLLLQFNIDNSLPELDPKLYRFGKEYTLKIIQRSERESVFFIWGVFELLEEGRCTAVLPFSGWVDNKEKEFKKDLSDLKIILDFYDAPKPSKDEIPSRWVMVMARKRFTLRFNGAIRLSNEFAGIRTWLFLINKWFRKPVVYYGLILIFYVYLGWKSFQFLLFW